MENNYSKIGAVILAAGKGTRLGCVDIPKVMLELNGKPIVAYTVNTLKSAGFLKQNICLVVGFCKEKVIEYFGDGVIFANQEEQKGTAHAAFIGIKALGEEVENVLVLGGDDSAFYTPDTLNQFVRQHINSGAVLSLLTAQVEDPSQLGRVVRHENNDVEIIEKEYLTEEQKKIKEISTGTFCFNRNWFEKIFPDMPTMRKLGEYGLPTALAMARNQKMPYQILKLDDSSEWFGVNTPEELAGARKRKINVSI